MYSCMLFFFIYLCHPLPPLLSISFSTFITPDNRALSISPINNQVSYGWVLVDTSLSSNWTFINNNTILPVLSNGTIGVTANFSISSIGYYDFSITISQSNSSTFSNIAFSYNSIPQSSQTSTNQSSLTFSITNQYLNSGTQQLAIWLDDSLSLNSVTVSQTVKFESVSVQLYSHPYYHQLYMVTNLTYTTVTNSTLFSTHTDLLISFNSNAGDVCFKSLGATTNPANFSSYTSSTNFTDLQQFYSYTVSATNTSILPNTSAGLLMVTVSNISFDCSAIANINFPQGQIFNDGFWKILSIQVNPVVEYIETILSQVKNYSFTHEISIQRLQIKIQNLYCNPEWNINDLTQRTSITFTSGGVCNIDFIWSWLYSFSIFCFNTSSVDTISQINVNFPNQYLRQASTNSLQNITLIPSQTVMVYMITNNATADVKYFQLQSKLLVTFNVTVSSSWSSNLTTQCIGISINSVSVSPININLVTNPQNYVQAYTILPSPLLATDSVVVSFNSFFNLNTVEGYHNVWDIVNTYQVQFFPSQFSSQFSSPVQSLELSLSYLFINPLRIVKYYIKGWNFLAFSYVINNLINFQSLICMYYFLNFKNSRHYYRKGIYEALLTIQSSSNYGQIIQNFLNKSVDLSITKTNPDPLSLYKNQQKQLNLHQLGYTVEFFNNTFQSLVQIFSLILKLILLKLLSLICFPIMRIFINYILYFWNQLLLFELIIMCPYLSIVIGSYFTSYNCFGFVSWLDKLNFYLNILIFFICLFSLFLLYLCQIYQNKFHSQSTKTQKNIELIENIDTTDKISKKSLKNIIQTISYNKFLDNSLYIILPFFIAIDNTILFISFMSVMVVYRLIRAIKTYSFYSKGEFLKQIINKLIWVLFNAIYVFYWLTQIFNLKCDEGFLVSILSFCDITQSILLIVGVLTQMLVTILQIFYGIYINIKYKVWDLVNDSKHQKTLNKKKIARKSKKKSIQKKNIKKYIQKRKSRFANVQKLIKIQNLIQNQPIKKPQQKFINKIQSHPKNCKFVHNEEQDLKIEKKLRIKITGKIKGKKIKKAI